ncbi:unnamed protein product [Lactuca saligna]|uniref:Peptidase M3A/M3B catalytic domain-containing protein n=1 Tax=Lactuca saligna TaxID=75948 RepID=A0AA35YXC2_LACSI|nr:unnamed protein product [Lactuca saligna]
MTFDVTGEGEQKLMECLMLNLCEHPCWSSCQGFSDMVISLDNMVDRLSDVKLQPTKVLTAICGLLQTLMSNKVTKERNQDYLNRLVAFDVASQASMELILKDDSQSMVPLGDLVIKIAENDQFDWLGRVKLIDCICNFVLLSLQIARRISVLFQTWDDHDELFQDILSNFSVKILVVLFKDKFVKANEVLAAGHQPRPIMETITVTLVHLALHSEKIELEAVFMICVIAAIDSSQRELVAAVLDNLSKKLQYNSRSEWETESSFMDDRFGCCYARWQVAVWGKGKLNQTLKNLYFQSGSSFLKCLLESWKKEEDSNTIKFNIVDVKGDDPNDDTCNICGDGGIGTSLFGMKFLNCPLAPGESWHPYVINMALHHPDEGKYPGCAHFAIRGGRAVSKTEYQLPVIAVVCNFSKPYNSSIVRLNHSDVDTLFHEFGHALHSLLSRTIEKLVYSFQNFTKIDMKFYNSRDINCGVRMLPAGSGMGVMYGMTRGIKMARPPFSSIMNSTTGLLTSSTPTPAPTLAQGNSMLRSREAMHMIRYGLIVKSTLQTPVGQLGSGSPWSLFEDQSLVVLVHDMDPTGSL